MRRLNEKGHEVSVHTCKTCGNEFTVIPPVDDGREGWENCLALECDSYDVTRDADLMFDVEPDLIHREDVR